MGKPEPQMDADERRYKHQELTRRIIGIFYEVYNELGFGFLESVYREAMLIALQAGGLAAKKDFPLQARFCGRVVAQTLNYLRAGVVEVALLLNFGPKAEVRRLAFENERKGACLAAQSTARLRSNQSLPRHLR
jgi:hypothetical protein